MMGLDRWSRLAANPSFGQGLGSLHGRRIVQVGAGTIGGAAIPHFAMMGVETTIIDRDVVSEENLGTQGFPEDMVGMPKAQVRAIAMGALNASWRVHSVHADFARVGMGVFADADLVLCALDSAAARASLSEVMTRVNRPWIDAAVDASGKPFGRVACYDPRRPESACYICPHDARSLAAHVRGGDVERCPSARAGEDAPPTLASSMLAAWVAALQVSWVIEVLLGRGDAIANSEAYMDLGALALRRHRLVRNPKCLFDHHLFAPILKVGAAASDLSIAETLALAARELGGDAQVRVWRDSAVSELRCPGCGAARRPFRLMGSLTRHDTACVCGAEMFAPAGALFDRFGAAEAEPFADRSWSDFGLPDGEIVGARRGDREIYLRFD